MISPFHLAFPVRDLESTRRFYVDVLGCREGRSTASWVDFDFFGHQLSAHVAPAAADLPGKVDGESVPIPHFGVILGWMQFDALRERLRAQGQTLDAEPALRFAGRTGEQASFFLRDPSGNALEFKAFRHPGDIFAD